MNHYNTYGIILILSSLLCSCGRSPKDRSDEEKREPSKEYPVTRDLSSGEKIYQERCASCHDDFLSSTIRGLPEERYLAAEERSFHKRAFEGLKKEDKSSIMAVLRSGNAEPSP
jgi:hypothetical protein